MEGKEELLGGQQSPLPLSYKFSEEDLGLPHVSGGLFQDSAPVCGNFLSSKIAQADFSSFSSLAQGTDSKEGTLLPDSLYFLFLFLSLGQLFYSPDLFWSPS